MKHFIDLESIKTNEEKSSVNDFIPSLIHNNSNEEITVFCFDEENPVLDYLSNFKEKMDIFVNIKSDTSNKKLNKSINYPKEVAKGWPFYIAIVVNDGYFFHRFDHVGGFLHDQSNSNKVKIIFKELKKRYFM